MVADMAFQIRVRRLSSHLSVSPLFDPITGLTAFCCPAFFPLRLLRARKASGAMSFPANSHPDLARMPDGQSGPDPPVPAPPPPVRPRRAGDAPVPSVPGAAAPAHDVPVGLLSETEAVSPPKPQFHVTDGSGVWEKLSEVWDDFKERMSKATQEIDGDIQWELIREGAFSQEVLLERAMCALAHLSNFRDQLDLVLRITRDLVSTIHMHILTTSGGFEIGVLGETCLTQDKFMDAIQLRWDEPRDRSLRHIKNRWIDSDSTGWARVSFDMFRSRADDQLAGAIMQMSMAQNAQPPWRSRNVTRRQGGRAARRKLAAARRAAGAVQSGSSGDERCPHPVITGQRREPRTGVEDPAISWGAGAFSDGVSGDEVWSSLFWGPAELQETVPMYSGPAPGPLNPHASPFAPPRRAGGASGSGAHSVSGQAHSPSGNPGVAPRLRPHGHTGTGPVSDRGDGGDVYTAL